MKNSANYFNTTELSNQGKMTIHVSAAYELLRQMVRPRYRACLVLER